MASMVLSPVLDIPHPLLGTKDNLTEDMKISYTSWITCLFWPWSFELNSQATLKKIYVIFTTIHFQ
jgi:hypothetical protein